MPRSSVSDESVPVRPGTAGAGPRSRHEPAPSAICETCFDGPLASPPVDRRPHRPGPGPHRHEGRWSRADRTMWRRFGAGVLCQGEVPGLPGAVARPPRRNRVWGLAMTPRRKEILRRDLGPWIAGLVMDGEIANDPKPPGRPGRCCARGRGPATRMVHCDGTGPLSLAERHETHQRRADIVELESQGASQLKYSSTACLKIVMTPPPATAGPGPEGPRCLPWRRSAWSQG